MEQFIYIQNPDSKEVEEIIIEKENSLFAI